MVKYFRQNRKELALGISHKTTPSTSTQKVMNPEPQMHAGINLKENVQHTFERLKCCITRHQQRLTTAPKNMQNNKNDASTPNTDGNKGMNAW